MIPSRRRNPATTRAEILDRAAETLAELGAAGFTLDAVADRTSVSKGALLHHFPTKIALLEALTDTLGEQIIAQVEAEAARDREPHGRNARAYLRVTLADAGTEADLSIGRVMLGACAMEPALAARWRQVSRRLTADDPTDPAGADDALMLRLIADGLWLSDLFGTYAVSPEQRRALLSLLAPGQTFLEVVDSERDA